MVHCAHILAPPCALTPRRVYSWAATTEPKSKRKVKTRLGDAIRALTPRRTKKTKEEVCIVENFKCPSLDEDISTALDECESPSTPKLKRRCGCNGASTRSGARTWSLDETSAELSTSPSTASTEEVTSLPGSVEEFPVSSSTSCASSPSAFSDDDNDYDDHVEVKCSSDAAYSEIECRKTELLQMAHLISRRASSKYSGRVSIDVRNAFLAADANADGKLSLTEMAAFCKHFELTPETTTRFFSLLDPHATGVVEWSSFWVKYAPVFRERSNFRLNPDERPYPAIQ